MVEALAHGVLNTVLPRHVAFMKSSSSLTRAASGTCRRPSLAANFFIPTPRSDKGKAKADDVAPVEEILGCQSWATPSSKKEIWNQDGVMRSTLLGELEDEASSRVFRHRTSQASRRRFHSPLPNSQSLPNPKVRFSYSTRSSTQAKEEGYASFVPPMYNKLQDEKSLTPYDAFIARLKYPAHSQLHLQLLHEAYVKVRDEGVFRQLSADDALCVLNLLADQIDSVCLISESRYAIGKLARNMSEIYSALDHSTVEEMKRLGKCDHMVCRMLAFQGNFEAATPLLQNLVTVPSTREFRTTYDSFLLSMARFTGLLSALQFWSEPEMKGLLHHAAKFGELLAHDITLKETVEGIIYWKKPRRSLAAQYCLKMAVMHKNTDKALLIMERMERMGLEPFFEHVLVLCKHLARKGDLPQAKELFNAIKPNNSQFYSQTKLYIYARSGDTAAALKVLEERKSSGQFQIEDRSNIFFSLSLAKQFDEMKEFFEASYPMTPDGIRSPKPPPAQYSICTLAHVRAGDVEEVNWWLLDMEKQGVKLNVQFFTHLLTLFKKIGDDRAMMNAYNQMLQSDIRPDALLYTLMLSHFANRKNSKAADTLYLDAIKQGVVPDEKMTSALMNAHIQSGSWKQALRIFRHLSSKMGRQKPSLFVYNTMLKAHLLLGAPFKVMTRLFLLIKEMGMQPDSYTYAILVLSACEAGRLTVAMEIVQEIKDQQLEQNRSDLLNSQILTILLSGFLRINDKLNAKKVLDEMVSLGLPPTDVTYAAIIKAYGSSHVQADMQQAEEFVKSLLASPDEMRHLGQSKSRKQPIANLYLPLLTASCEKGDVAEVERLYNEFLQADGRPTIAVYHTLLSVYRQTDNIHKTLELWPRIERLAKRKGPVVRPSEEETESQETSTHVANIQAPLSIYLDMLSKFGMHGEVSKTWFRLQKAGFRFDAQNWNHVVVVLLRAAVLERAFEVMEKVLLPRAASNNLNTMIGYESRKLQGLKQDEKPDPLDSYVPVYQGLPLWGSKNRIRVAELGSTSTGKKRSKGVDIDQIDKDFAYPMRVLEYIRPTWNDWRPHDVVWRALLVVWLQLEKNYVPKVLELGGDMLHNVAIQDISDRNAEAAQKMITKLQIDYPKTVSNIRRFRRIELRRMTKAAFDKLYLP